MICEIHRAYCAMSIKVGVHSRYPWTPQGHDWLWHAQSIHVFMRVSERWVRRPAATTAAGARCIAVKRPVARGRQVIGDHKGVDGIDIVQACDLVLSISLTNHHRDSDVSEWNTGLRVKRLRRGDGGLAHIARVVYHHAVAGSGGTIIKRHEVDDVIARQPQTLDFIHHRCAGASSRNRVCRPRSKRLNGKAE